MKSKFTKIQKIVELSILGIWIAWIVAIFNFWNSPLLNQNNKNSLIMMVILGLVIYGILSLFTLLPNTTNIITSKKYNDQNKQQIIKLTRTFFCCIKLTLILGFASLSLIKVFYKELESAISIIFYLSLAFIFIKYWLDYKKIPN